MSKIKKSAFTMAKTIFLVILLFGQSHVHANTVIMNFDSPAMPPSVFGGNGQVYSQNGFENTSINFNDSINQGSHIHGAFNGGSRVSQLEPDAGGGLFRAASGENFAFTSWDMVALVTNLIIDGDSPTIGDASNLHVVGFDNGVQVSETVLISSAEGTTVNFGPTFDNVDLVEYWFEEPGRGEDPGSNSRFAFLLAEIDNVTFSDPIPAVPEPETYIMFIVGLGLVRFVANRRKNSSLYLKRSSVYYV